MNRTLTLTLIGMALVASMTAAFAWTHTRTGFLGTGGTKVLKYWLPATEVYVVDVVRLAGAVNYNVRVVDPSGTVIAVHATPGNEHFTFNTTMSGTYRFVIHAQPIGAGLSRGKYLFRIYGRQNGDPIGG